jgi:hypothetical protein
MSNPKDNSHNLSAQLDTFVNVVKSAKAAGLGNVDVTNLLTALADTKTDLAAV